MIIIISSIALSRWNKITKIDNIPQINLIKTSFKGRVTFVTNFCFGDDEYYIFIITN